MNIILSTTLAFALVTPSLSYALDSEDTGDECTYLWVERNYFYAQKGYCFSSKIARDIFNNGMGLDPEARCPKLNFSKAEKSVLQHIRKTEKRYECNKYQLKVQVAKNALIKILREKVEKQSL
ncbi:MAG: YARHG domain-containing protein [Cocleimonas sp.]|nr:YARHG domain-containing protein [Cocleimonas sp.]